MNDAVGETIRILGDEDDLRNLIRTVRRIRISMTISRLTRGQKVKVKQKVQAKLFYSAFWYS